VQQGFFHGQESRALVSGACPKRMRPFEKQLYSSNRRPAAALAVFLAALRRGGSPLRPQAGGENIRIYDQSLLLDCGAYSSSKSFLKCRNALCSARARPPRVSTHRVNA